MIARSLPELVQELPPDAQEVVRDLVEYLLAQSRATEQSGPVPTLRQDWAGALRAYRRQYTSLELQHLAADWRSAL